MATESNQSQKAQSQPTTNNSASTNSKQPNTPPAKGSEENKNNSSNNTKKNQVSNSTKSKGSTSIDLDKGERRMIPGVDASPDHYSISNDFSSKQLDELGL